MQNNIRKSWNNTLAPPVREIQSNLGKNADFIDKETHRFHNSVSENWHRAFFIVSSLGPCW